VARSVCGAGTPLTAALCLGEARSGRSPASFPLPRVVGVFTISEGASSAASKERSSNQICWTCTKPQGECPGARNWTVCQTMEDSSISSSLRPSLRESSSRSVIARMDPHLDCPLQQECRTVDVTYCYDRPMQTPVVTHSTARTRRASALPPVCGWKMTHSWAAVQLPTLRTRTTAIHWRVIPVAWEDVRCSAVANGAAHWAYTAYLRARGEEHDVCWAHDVGDRSDVVDGGRAGSAGAGQSLMMAQRLVAVASAELR
jgi:hypothetical protein